MFRIYLAVCLITLVSSELSRKDLSEDEKAVVDRTALWVKYVNQLKFDRLMTLYADNPVLLPNQGPVINGKTDIKNTLVSLFPAVIARMEYVGPLYIEVLNDNTIYINNLFTSYDAEKQPTKLKDTVLWRKIDDEWYLDRDMFNEGY